jgi:hypothetical protein
MIFSTYGREMKSLTQKLLTGIAKKGTIQFIEKVSYLGFGMKCSASIIQINSV